MEIISKLGKTNLAKLVVCQLKTIIDFFKS